MDTVQLTYILQKDKYTQASFQGVYPSDKLTNRIDSYPALIIANADTSGKPGSHWVAFYFTENREGEFFLFLRVTYKQLHSNFYNFFE